MHITPTRQSNTPIKQKQQAIHSTFKKPAQHGLLSPDCPPETLNWITSYLVPKELLSLSLVSKHLNTHINQDSTWRTAFASFFLSLDPETDWGNQALLFRRREATWRKEFILRFNVISRWQKSRSTTVSHDPHHSPSASLLLIPEASALLSASTTYGIVARSHPHTGKILKGFLDAAGISNGRGIGNPNAEFSPDVSTVMMQAWGRSAQIIWGFQSGGVAVTFAPKVMDQGRSSKMMRCRHVDSHASSVVKIAAAEDGQTFVTAGLDGRVKLWDAKVVRCLWTWTPPESSPLDPCSQVAYDASAGIMAAVFLSGDFYIWRITHANKASEPPNVLPIHHFCQPPAAEPSERRACTTLELYTSALDINILIYYQQDLVIIRFTVVIDENSKSVSVVKTEYVDGPVSGMTIIKSDIATGSIVTPPVTSAPVTSPLGAFASALPTPSRRREQSVIIAGDTLGMVSIWPWDADDCHIEGGTRHIKSGSRFGAHDDGGVSALCLEGLLLATGSTQGTIKVWDTLTFLCLRVIPTPVPRPFVGSPWPKVDHIILDKDTVIGAVGPRVAVWQVGNVSNKGTKGKPRVKHWGSLEKWRERVDLKNDVIESRGILQDERQRTIGSSSRGSELAQRSKLDVLGLTEAEAIQYVLMLSREEEEAERVARAIEATHPSPSSPVRNREGLDFYEGSETEGSWEISETASQSASSVTSSADSPSYMTPIPSPLATPPTPRSLPNTTAWDAISATSVQSFQAYSPPRQSFAQVASTPPRAANPSIARRTANPQPSGSRSGRTQEEADLMLAIELSLAEANSRNDL